MIASHALVTEGCGRPKAFSNDISALLAGVRSEVPEVEAVLATGWPQQTVLLMADPPAHSRYRKLVNLAFSLERVEAIEHRIRALVSGNIALFATLAAFSFCWMFVPPFQMPLLIGIDPTLRTAMLIGSAQLLGNAVGPLLASGVVGEADVQPAAVISLACAGLCIALTVTAGWMRNRVSLAAGVSP